MSGEFAAIAISSPSADHEAHVEYDRRRMTKESLLERAIATCVETAGAVRLLTATLHVVGDAPQVADDEQRQIVSLLAALLRRDADASRVICQPLRGLLQQGSPAVCAAGQRWQSRRNRRGSRSPEFAARAARLAAAARFVGGGL